MQPSDLCACRPASASCVYFVCFHRAPNPTVTPSDIESSTQKIADEFAEMGIDLQTALKGKVGLLKGHAAQELNIDMRALDSSSQ